jgi:hypothetical protein
LLTPSRKTRFRFRAYKHTSLAFLVGVFSGYPLEDQKDLSAVLEILGRNYDRAKAAAKRRGSQDAKE